MIPVLISGVILGLCFVWKASDRVVAHALRLARHYNVSTFFVGFVLLALAANVPDLAVTIASAFQGVGQLAAGDIIGACFSDIALITGVTLACARSTVMNRYEAMGFLRLILGAAVVMIVVFSCGSLTKLHGLGLLMIYVTFLVWAWKNRHGHVLFEVSQDDLDHPKRLPVKGLIVVWGKIAGALSLVLAGSGLAIHCGVSIAQSWGLSLELVGATIIAFGTSLPEISMGFHAFRRGQYTLALGPTIGTVFSQSTFILGTLALLSSQPINLAGLQGAAVFMFTAFFIIVMSIILDRIGRATGVVLVMLFIIYMLYHLVGF
jgi:cation:H+ antiporter